MSNDRGDQLAAASPNFDFLEGDEPLLILYATQAERYVLDDPNTAMFKLRQFGEVLAQQVAAYSGFDTAAGESQLDLLSELAASGVVDYRVGQMFHALRRSGNRAVHEHADDQGDA